MFYKKGILKISQYHWKTPVLESFFNNVAGLEACSFIKNRLQQCFPMKTAKFLSTPFLKNICERLLFSYAVFIKKYSQRKCMLISEKRNSLVKLLFSRNLGNQVFTCNVYIFSSLNVINQDSEENTCARVSF